MPVVPKPLIYIIDQWSKHILTRRCISPIFFFVLMQLVMQKIQDIWPFTEVRLFYNQNNHSIFIVSVAEIQWIWIHINNSVHINEKGTTIRSAEIEMSRFEVSLPRLSAVYLVIVLSCAFICKNVTPKVRKWIYF